MHLAPHILEADRLLVEPHTDCFASYEIGDYLQRAIAERPAQAELASIVAQNRSAYEQFRLSLAGQEMTSLTSGPFDAPAHATILRAVERLLGLELAVAIDHLTRGEVAPFADGVIRLLQWASQLEQGDGAFYFRSLFARRFATAACKMRSALPVAADPAVLKRLWQAFAELPPTRQRYFDSSVRCQQRLWLSALQRLEVHRALPDLMKAFREELVFHPGAGTWAEIRNEEPPMPPESAFALARSVEQRQWLNQTGFDRFQAIESLLVDQPAPFSRTATEELLAQVVDQFETAFVRDADDLAADELLLLPASDWSIWPSELHSFHRLPATFSRHDLDLLRPRLSATPNALGHMIASEAHHSFQYSLTGNIVESFYLSPLVRHRAAQADFESDLR